MSYQRKEQIGDAMFYIGAVNNCLIQLRFSELKRGSSVMEMTLEQARALPSWQRSRLRKQGVAVPILPRKRGYKQTPEHIEKRIRRGADHYAWQGDAVSATGGRARALRAYPEIGPCVNCGSEKSERHHKDENTANNDPDNIVALCRSCHMKEDGRLAQFMEMARCPKK